MQKNHKSLDKIDKQILRELQNDGRMSNVELSRRVNLSPTPCLERVRRLEQHGFITGYMALLDPVSNQSLVVSSKSRLIEQPRTCLTFSQQRSANCRKSKNATWWQVALIT